MPITVIKGPDGVRTLFTATETIIQGRVLKVATGTKRVGLLASGFETKVAGVAAEGVSSGALVRVVTQGVVSGIRCTASVSEGQPVQGAQGTSGLISGSGGYIIPLTSGVGAMLGKALASGAFYAEIPVLVDLG